MKHFRNEDKLVKKITRHFLPRKPGGLRMGIGDDAALWRCHAGFETILTSDWFLEGSHFLLEKHPPDSVGWKCLARAASDIAAMGGTPRCFLLNLALPDEATGKWLESFLKGLRHAAKSLDCVLAGGDTTRSRRILISVSVIGEIREGEEVLRSTAQPGDLLYVSGTLGEAEHGLRLLRTKQRKVNRRDPAMRKHLYPEPRVELGRWLVERKLATAMMDLSDGLSADLPRLCKASKVGAVIDPGRLPVLVGVPANFARQMALHGGDDYELLFTVSPGKAALIPASYRGLRFTRIGEITKGSGLRILGKAGRSKPLPAGGWDPFR